MEREPRIQIPGQASRKRTWEREYDRLKHIAELRREGDIFQDSLSLTIDSQGFPYFFFLPMSDLHIGNKGTDYDKLHEYLTAIQHYPFYTVTVGDTVDFFNPKIFADGLMEDVIDPNEQMRAIKLMYESMGDKLLGMMWGNHEGFARQAGGIEAVEWMIGDLDKPMLQNGAFFDFNINGIQYNGRLFHRIGRFNSQLNRTHAGKQAIRYSDPALDFVVSGHTHQGALEHAFVGKRPIVIEQMGSFKTDDEWLKQIGAVEPVMPFFPILAFDTRKKNIEVVTNLDSAIEFCEAITDIWKRKRVKKNERVQSVQDTGLSAK